MVSARLQKLTINPTASNCTKVAESHFQQIHNLTSTHTPTPIVKEQALWGGNWECCFLTPYTYMRMQQLTLYQSQGFLQPRLKTPSCDLSLVLHHTNPSISVSAEPIPKDIKVQEVMSEGYDTKMDLKGWDTGSPLRSNLQELGGCTNANQGDYQRMW